jgi:hypothetical protein
MTATHVILINRRILILLSGARMPVLPHAFALGALIGDRSLQGIPFTSLPAYGAGLLLPDRVVAALFALPLLLVPGFLVHRQLPFHTVPDTPGLPFILGLARAVGRRRSARALVGRRC